MKRNLRKPVFTPAVLAATLMLTPPGPTARAQGAAEAPVPEVGPGETSGEGIRLNFRGAPLADVLNYLSEAAGFVIVTDEPPRGTVNVVSHQAMTADEAFDLLNTVLVDQGYVALRNGRILKIVPRDEAHTHYLPVRTGNDPEQIPLKDEMVTQIIPVRYAEVEPLIENIRPLLADATRVTANESSNAIVMTDTLVNIRRVAEIVRALDTSMSGISTVRVFPLQFADATQLAEVIGQVFEQEQTGGSRGGGDRRRGPWGRGGGDDNGGSDSDSPVLAAGSRVVAVADERSNAVVVSAAEAMMPMVEQLIVEMDTNVSDITEVRVFPLENADAVELAELITDLYEEVEEGAENSRTGGRGRFPFRPPGRGDQSNNGDESPRSLAQGKVVAVGDPRTNSLLVSAARESMMEIAELVGRLDASSAKKERVFVYSLEHADVDNVAAILRGMFGDTDTGTREGQVGNLLVDRASSGAAVEMNSTFGGLSGGTGGGRR